MIRKTSKNDNLLALFEIYVVVDVHSSLRRLDASSKGRFLQNAYMVRECI